MENLFKNADLQWNGKPVAHPSHKAHLDHTATIHEFEGKLPQAQAREKAYKEYQHSQRIEAAAHHLAGMKAAQAAGDDKAAAKHSAMYELHCKAIGHEPVGEPHPDVVAQMQKKPSKLYRFKVHPGDVFAVADHTSDAKKSERCNVLASGLETVIQILKKKSPPGRAKEVEELKAKGLPASEAFGIAWKQHNEHGKPKDTDKAEELPENLEESEPENKARKQVTCRCSNYSHPHRLNSHPTKKCSMA